MHDRAGSSPRSFPLWLRDLCFAAAKKKKKRESRHVEADEMLNLDVLRRLAGLELSCRVQTCVSRAGENLARTRAQNPGTRGSAA